MNDFEFKNGSLSMCKFDGGYLAVPFVPSTYRYYITDHLGNNSLVVYGSGSVQQATHYYPFGSIHHSSTNQGYQKYKYNGKEYDTMHGLNEYDYGARQYDPAIGMFTSIDPMCEKYYHISPYAYCGGNPVRYVDPDGRWLWDCNGNLVAQKGDDAKSMAKYLGTSSSNALQILIRCGVKANSKGILNLSDGQVLNKSNLWVGTKSKNAPIVNNTKEAVSHYYYGDGKAVDVGDQATKELLSSEKFQSKLNKITSQVVESEGFFSVDMTNMTFHIGRTNVDYKIVSNATSSSVTFTLFSNDGFWDPDFIDEKVLGKGLGIPLFQPDGMGPNLERGGIPYQYKTRTRTYFF